MINEKRQQRELARRKRECLRDENKKFGNELREVPRSEWSAELLNRPAHTIANRAWRSRHFLVQLWLDPSGFQRLSINRAELDSDGGWREGISWDEMMQLKDEAGFGRRWAVECYPPTQQIVNVANIRHLWLLDNPPHFGWHPSDAAIAGDSSPVSAAAAPSAPTRATSGCISIAPA